MPTLKQLVSGASGANRRSRADLKAEMISAPLADFRHTLHVGRGGDAFGDTSFLSISHKSTNDMPKNSLLPHRFRGSKRSQSERKSSAMSYMLPANSEISLPYVSEDQDPTPRLPKSTSLNFREMNRNTAVTGGRSIRMEAEHFRETSHFPMITPSSQMKQTESMLSFHIDLGPSMLGDVLSVMDQTKQDHQDLSGDQGRGLKIPHPLNSLVSSSCGVKEEDGGRAGKNETRSPTYSVNIDDNDFLFMDEDEEEIRV